MRKSPVGLNWVRVYLRVTRSALFLAGLPRLARSRLWPQVENSVLTSRSR